MKKRNCQNNFIESYLDYSKVTESPDQYSRWCAIAAISSCLGGLQVPPKISVALVATNSSCRMTTTVHRICAMIDHVQGTIKDLFISECRSEDPKSVGIEPQTIIVRTEPSKRVVTMPICDRETQDDLIADLKQITTLRGEYTVDSKIQELLVGQPAIVCRVMTCLSAARDDVMTLNESDYVWSLDLLDNVQVL